MTSFEPALASIRLGWAEYLAANPWRIIATTGSPRAVLQCLFFTVLGRVTAGDTGGRFAFVGSVAMVMMLSTAAGIGDVPAIEKWAGTFYRLQFARTSPYGIFALRAMPWVVQGVVDAVLCIAIVGPLTGNGQLSIDLLPLLPVFVLMAVTSAAAGLAAAAPAVGRRADVVVANGLVYLVIASGGLVIPQGRLTVLDAIGSVLPLTHGVRAVRAGLAGAPFGGQVLLEALVGIGWGVAGALLYRRLAARARRTGSDDFL